MTSLPVCTRIASTGIIAMALGLTADRVHAAQTPIPLDYNFNGMVSNATETGTANADDPSGFRSVSDRALHLALAGGFGSSTLTGNTGLIYSITTADHTLDIVHLGDRTILFPFDNIAGNNIGVYPAWLDTADHINNPQTTLIDPPILLDADTDIGILYQISNGGGNFDVTLGFTDFGTVTVTLKGPDWFNTQAAWYSTNFPNFGVRSHNQLGTYPSVQNNDAAAATASILNVVESVISAWKLDADGIGNVVGRELNSITFSNPNVAQQRGYAILATTVGVDMPPPANDDCASATAIGNGTFAGGSDYATVDGSASCNPFDDRDVWFSYTVPAGHTRARASLCGSTFDTTLAVFTTCGGTEVACSDNFPGCANSNRSEVIWDVTPGSVWKIRIGGADGGRGVYSLTTTSSAPPSNDECAGATAIGNATVNVNTATTLYGAGVGVPTTPCGGGNDTIDAWYSYTVPNTAGLSRARASLCSSAIDTTVAIYDACGGTLIACNNDDGTCATGTRSDVVWGITPGSVWKIRVAGVDAARGAITMTTSSGTAPANDDCSGAQAVGEGTVSASTIFAGGGGGSTCNGNDPADIWYVYTPTATGTARASLCASNFNTTLAIYDACGGSEIACNDDSGTCANANRSETTWSVDQGTPYWIRIAGSAGTRGTTASLTIALLPANDECGSCTPVGEGVFGGSTAAAGGVDESSCATSDTKDVWFCYTASQTGTTTISLCGSTFDTTLTVFDSCGGTELLCDDDSMIGTCSPTATTLQSWAAIRTVENATYLIRIAGFNGASGNYTLTIAAVAPVENDLCEDCTPISEGVVTGSSTNATGDQNSGCSTTDHYDVWYCYTATSSGTARAALCGSAFNTTLAVYDACLGNEIACNDNSTICGTGSVQSSLTWTAVENSAYLIRIAGSAGGFVGPTTGAYTLTISNPGNVVCGPIVNPANGHTYYLIYPSNWFDAETQAVELGGHLVTINDADENEWVRANVLTCGGVDRRGWIGLTDEALEDTFAWTSGEVPNPFFLNWAAGEPNNANGTEHYVEMLGGNGQWNDLPAAGATAGDYGIVEVETSCPGDVNGDNTVNLTDLATLLANFGVPSGATRSQGDLDDDGDVDLTDLATLLANFGTTCD